MSGGDEGVMSTKTYEGWKNYATWNVSLWLNNEEPLYRAACDFMRTYKGKAPYKAFVDQMGLAGTRTLDRIKWDGANLDYRALNEMMRELIA